MVFGYIRVSTDKQDTENQKLGINEKAAQLGLRIDEWISDDGISGAKEPEKRLLGKLLHRVEKGDVIIVSEISRLGRKLFMVFRILEGLMEKEVKLYSVKDAYNLDNTITSKVLAFAFGMAAEIERDMIQKRTKEGLARKKAEGVILGRPVGSTTRSKILAGKQEEIQAYLNANISLSALGRIYKCHRITVYKFIIDNNLDYSDTELREKMKIIGEKADKNGNYARKKGADVSAILLPNVEKIKDMIRDGKTQIEIANEFTTDGTSIRSVNVTTFLKKQNLWEFYVKTNLEVRKERNKNSGMFNPKKLNQYAGN